MKDAQRDPNLPSPRKAHILQHPRPTRKLGRTPIRAAVFAVKITVLPVTPELHPRSLILIHKRGNTGQVGAATPQAAHQTARSLQGQCIDAAGKTARGTCKGSH